ncbi:uncharacterized protein LOC127137227 [Lathyrus oleraceus]|uniref:uncharacterized protein LOC127137227 n=1 Tax=Pisum sativum TaxID=3888 RepID=UPI0021D1F77C|nr:uncharacterized protein LOC127137227 [Pisum sativum]
MGNYDCQAAFDKIKKYLQEPPILIPLVPSRSLIMYLTVLDESMGCILGQYDDTSKIEHTIYYLSKKFTEYMIKYIFEKPAVTGRIARWQMLLTEYDIQYVTQKVGVRLRLGGNDFSDMLNLLQVGLKFGHVHYCCRSLELEYAASQDSGQGNVLHDIKWTTAATRLALILHWLNRAFPWIGKGEGKFWGTTSGSEINPEEGPEPGSQWTLVFDGASNSRGHGISAVITYATGFHLPFTTRLCFDCTNNMEKYEACTYRLEVAIDLRIQILEVYRDSALVISQVKVKWKNEAPTIHIDHIDEPTHCLEIEAAPDDKPRFYDIKTFLEKQQYPGGISITDKKALRRLSSKFFLNGDVLYKRTYDFVLLRCVDRHEASTIIKSIHEGCKGVHAKGPAIVKKILRSWVLLEDNGC